MEDNFWHECWEADRIGFHRKEVHPFLHRFHEKIGTPPETTVFVPMCGKSVDMLWLAQKGYKVVGVELSPIAVEAFFAENSLAARRSTLPKFEVWEWENIRIFCGDFFSLDSSLLVGINAVYDRAALVALPPAMRHLYAEHLLDLLSPGCRLLTICYVYDEKEMDGPPFSVSEIEIETLFSRCDLEVLANLDALELNRPLKERGLTKLRELVWNMNLIRNP